MLNIFQRRPFIEQQSAEWIFDTFYWVLTNFDSKEFFARSRLVQPTNEYFSGSVDSVHGKAENVFNHTLKYTGLSHWPFKLQAPEEFINSPLPQLNIGNFNRDSSDVNLPALAKEQPLYITYNPQQTLKPEDLASSFAHLIAQHTVYQSQKLPPGGAEYLAEATEVFAIVMGFGVVFANSAYTFRGGCGSCYNAQANRQATLSENEVLFSLAIYCRLKDIPTEDATRHLKKHLRSGYKSALKQVKENQEMIARLIALINYPR